MRTGEKRQGESIKQSSWRMRKGTYKRKLQTVRQSKQTLDPVITNLWSDSE